MFKLCVHRAHGFCARHPHIARLTQEHAHDLLLDEFTQSTRFSVRLSREPVTDVVVGLVAAAALFEGNATTASLRFTAANWNVAQELWLGAAGFNWNTATEPRSVQVTLSSAAAEPSDLKSSGLPPTLLALWNTAASQLDVKVVPRPLCAASN